MNRYRLEYNGIVSEFNAKEVGGFQRNCNGKVVEIGKRYIVRSSKSNVMDIKELTESFDDKGKAVYHFWTRGYKKQPRGLKLVVTRLK